MISNFEFLKDKFPILFNLGSLAEKYCYTDSNSCLTKLGMIGETIVNLIVIYDNVLLPEKNNAAIKIKFLHSEGLLTKDLVDILNELRDKRNKAVHKNYSSTSDSKLLLEMTHSLCEWFMQTYGDWNYKSKKFIMPQDNQEEFSFDKVAEEKLEIKLKSEAESVARNSEKIKREERVKRVNVVSNNRRKSEAEVRFIIDKQLRQVGWEVDSENLKYSKGISPSKGRNIAISEWPTISKDGKKGFADYVLFIGLKMVGIIEAKAEHKDVSSVIDYQCKEYSQNIRDEDYTYIYDLSREYKVPFVFASNGRKYLEQYKTKSGIWFLDLRKPFNVPRPLSGWISPEGIMELLDKDIENGNEKLKKLSNDFLRDEDGLNLREYQLKAIDEVEKAVINGKKNVLLAMATGTGKTRTILGIIYRFLKSNRFKRILFLVDRTSLGEQAQDVFKEVKIEELMTLDNIYNIKGLNDSEIDKETRVKVATVQSMVKQLIYNDEEKMPSVTDYDLIIVDEAHRGYILDRDMSDTEFLYDNHIDYQSKYRFVIDYFDAIKIGLTATPALQTTEIFGAPVFKYTYREAVIDGFLVDHDAPYNIKTKLNTEGIHYNSGDKVAVYDNVTGEILNSEEIDDEIDFNVEDFNRKVITENFNRTVLKEIASYIDPEDSSQGKTLIYAVDDKHADMIVSILKEIYANFEIDNNAIMKITGSVGGGNPRKVQEAIKRFKNEKFPSIAVTVDLLTTGIDVPEITNLVFMRCVKSRILFEQMLGRATRLCNKINKTHFNIFDAVGVYDALKDFNTMKPAVVDSSTTFNRLIDILHGVENEEEINYQIDQIIGKIQRKKRSIKEGKDLENFISLSGGKNPDEFINEIKCKDFKTAKDFIISYRNLFDFLEKTKSTNKLDRIIISDKEDDLLEVTRNYGNFDKPEDYLDSFSEYLKNNMNEITALKIICTKPRELTRKDLKDLKLILDREGFDENKLNSAISNLTNEEISSDIISIIRRYAIGSPLLNIEDRVKDAVKKLEKKYKFSKIQLKWLERIENYLIKELVFDLDVFESDTRFKREGGFNKINKAFNNELENIIIELKEYLYDDGGKSA